MIKYHVHYHLDQHTGLRSYYVWADDAEQAREIFKNKFPHAKITGVVVSDS